MPTKTKAKSNTKSKPTTKLTKETYMYWYEIMLRQRRFEEKAGQLYGQQKIRGFCHLNIGQEAVSAGVVSATEQEDILITAYRDHGLALAKGMTCKECMAELFGKVTGSSKGKGGSMHFFSKEKYFYGGHGIVGGQIPLGAGLAFAEKYNETGRLTVTFFGDGAARQGSLHETFNMAMTWKLPVIFICENNQYAMGTSVERTSNVTDLYKLGCAYDMPSKEVDGMSPEKVLEAMNEAVAHVRAGNGPYYLEMKTYRYKGHSMSDPAKYRSKDELEDFKGKDPIAHVLDVIKKNKYATEEEIKEIQEDIKQEIEECVKFAEESEYPGEEELYNDTYAEEGYPYITD